MAEAESGCRPGAEVVASGKADADAGGRPYGGGMAETNGDKTD